MAVHWQAKVQNYVPSLLFSNFTVTKNHLRQVAAHGIWHSTPSSLLCGSTATSVCSPPASCRVCHFRRLHSDSLPARRCLHKHWHQFSYFCSVCCQQPPEGCQMFPSLENLIRSDAHMQHVFCTRYLWWSTDVQIVVSIHFHLRENTQQSWHINAWKIHTKTFLNHNYLTAVMK